jgi:hypothetical protein
MRKDSPLVPPQVRTASRRRTRNSKFLLHECNCSLEDLGFPAAPFVHALSIPW